MNKSSAKKDKRDRRHGRIRSRITGTKDRPRLCVFRSNKFLYAQLIDDEKGVTVGAIDTKKMKGKTLRERANEAGTELASIAKKAKIEQVVFDRGGFLFTGSIKEFAEAARKGGLQF
jgi:large subunit ribosomal protein L18